MVSKNFEGGIFVSLWAGKSEKYGSEWWLASKGLKARKSSHVSLFCPAVILHGAGCYPLASSCLEWKLEEENWNYPESVIFSETATVQPPLGQQEAAADDSGDDKGKWVLLLICAISDEGLWEQKGPVTVSHPFCSGRPTHSFT